MRAAFYDLEPQQVTAVKSFAEKLSLDLLVCETKAFLDSTSESARDCEILSTFMSSVISKENLAKMPNLKLIATRSTGFDHVDLDEVRRRGIQVVNVPAYGEETVAEYAFALLLALSRRLIPTALATRQGKFDQNQRGVDLSGKTMGVIGTGRIGRNFIRMARAGFAMNVIAYDAYPNEALVNDYQVRYVSIEELLQESDAISVHCPYLPTTHHLINRQNIGLLKTGVLLVNTARGPVIEVEALKDGLEKNIFGGLGLDAFEGEDVWIQQEDLLQGTFQAHREQLNQAVVSYLLQRYPNVILTPHNAFNSVEAVNRIFNTSLENIEQFVRGEQLNNLIPPLKS